MLTDSKKPQFSYLRRLMILPLLVAVVCLFAFTIKKEVSSSPPQNTITEKQFVLVVDAGHGGKDLGATGNGLHEKDVTLKIAKKIKELAPQYGVDIILTRDNDVFMAPPEKIEFANAQHADAFISLHVNAAEKSEQEQSGFEVVLSRKNPQEFSSVLLGSAILQSLQPDFKTAPSLQQKSVGIWVLEKSIAPAALIECGYLTNSGDVDLLKDDSKIELIAKEILGGVALYANNKSSISQKNIMQSNRDTTFPAKTNSISATQIPLYVLDGKIISTEKADKLDPSSIEQMNVLKDKNATNKYGDKGKNGVVEIISKNTTNEREIPPPPPPIQQ